jgi:dipeptide/tripeptide permease
MGVAAPIATGYVVGLTGSFSGAFLIAGVVLLIGILAYIVLLGDIAPLPDRDATLGTVPASRIA